MLIASSILAHPDAQVWTVILPHCPPKELEVNDITADSVEEMISNGED